MESVTELRTGRLRQKTIHIVLRYRVARSIRFRLNGPGGPVHSLGDEVNTGIRSPTTGPLVPEPDFLQLGAIDGSVEPQGSCHLSSTVHRGIEPRLFAERVELSQSGL